MRQGLVRYTDDDYDVEIVVVQCSLAQGFKRSSAQAINTALMKVKEKEGVALGFLDKFIAFRTHPECVGSTTEVRNLDVAKKQLSVDIGLEDFMQLPEALVVTWEKVVYQMNPHWAPKMPEPAEKKEEGKEEPQGEVKEPGTS